MSSNKEGLKRAQENWLKRIRATNRELYPNGLADLPFNEWYCKPCGKMYPITQFYFNPSTKYGVDNMCRKCHNKASVKSRSKRNYPRISGSILLQCPKCGLNKPARAFNKDRGSKLGIGYKCAQCDKKSAQQWRDKRKSTSV